MCLAQPEHWWIVCGLDSMSFVKHVVGTYNLCAIGTNLEITQTD